MDTEQALPAVEPTKESQSSPSRWGVLMGNPRRLIIALVLILVAVGVAVFASATFTTSSANAGNVIATGSLTVDNSKNGAAVLTASGLVPGDSSNGTVQISNTGSSSGTFTLATANLKDTPGTPGGPPLSGKVDLLIEDTTVAGTPKQIYTGKLNAVPTIQLGKWNAGESHTYKFTITFPDTGTPSSPTTGDNAYKNASTSVDFVWNAVS